jgi:LDH2 family malate/lactate/ureidoglycolate dehydrogenase
MNSTHDRVCRQIVNVLRAWSMAQDLVQTTADAMIETDLLGVDTHGISMLMTYEARKLEGKPNVTAKPTIVRETPAMALIDGQAELGHPMSVAGAPVATERECRLKNGIPIPEKVDQYTRDICARCGAACCLT